MASTKQASVSPDVTNHLTESKMCSSRTPFVTQQQELRQVTLDGFGRGAKASKLCTRP